MARGAGVGADDGIGAERLAGGADAGGAVAEVDAVEAEAGDEADVVGDHQRHVAGVRHGAERVGGAGDVVLVRAGKGQAQAGDVEAVEERREDVGQPGIEGGRGDQVELRALGRGGHQRRRIERPA